jgi:hypothetical protein
MGIERLNKAAEAAGFAMAPEDDVPAGETAPVISSESRALVPQAAFGIASLQQQVPSTLPARFSTWIRGYMPSFGGRAPA